MNFRAGTHCHTSDAKKNWVCHTFLARRLRIRSRSRDAVASNPDVGSSRNRILRSASSSSASVSRRFCPPLRLPAFVSRLRSNAVSSMTLFVRQQDKNVHHSAHPGPNDSLCSNLIGTPYILRYALAKRLLRGRNLKLKQPYPSWMPEPKPSLAYSRLDPADLSLEGTRHS